MKLFKDKSKEIKELQPGEPPKPPGEEEFAPPAQLPEIKKPLPRPAAPSAPSTAKSPPLFIKVDKYRDIVKNIRDLKSQLLNLRDAVDVLEDIQKEVANGISLAHKTLDQLNMVISNLDSFFMRPQGVEHHMEEDVEEPGEVENYVTDVHTQLEKLRAQLRAME